MKRSLPATIRALAPAVLVLTSLALNPPRALAHCDTLDGPVVQAARKALETGDVRLVLLWVQPKDEREIGAAFTKTLAVRRLAPEARELADMYFFETLVRVHRAGEGEPYTGLRPAANDLGPVIPAVDKALEERNVDPLVKLLTDAVRDGIRERYRQAIARRVFNTDDVAAGRAYVEAYVPLLHYAERIHETATGPMGHAPGRDESAVHHDKDHQR
jgi:hypothetical protein